MERTFGVEMAPAERAARPRLQIALEPLCDLGVVEPDPRPVVERVAIGTDVMPLEALGHISCKADVETIGIRFTSKHVHQIAIGHALPARKDRAVRLRSLRELRLDILR